MEKSAEKLKWRSSIPGSLYCSTLDYKNHQEGMANYSGSMGDSCVDHSDKLYEHLYDILYDSVNEEDHVEEGEVYGCFNEGTGESGSMFELSRELKPYSPQVELVEKKMDTKGPSETVYTGVQALLEDTMCTSVVDANDEDDLNQETSPGSLHLKPSTPRRDDSSTSCVSRFQDISPECTLKYPKKQCRHERRRMKQTKHKTIRPHGCCFLTTDNSTRRHDSYKNCLSGEMQQVGSTGISQEEKDECLCVLPVNDPKSRFDEPREAVQNTRCGEKKDQGGMVKALIPFTVRPRLWKKNPKILADWHYFFSEPTETIPPTYSGYDAKFLHPPWYLNLQEGEDTTPCHYAPWMLGSQNTSQHTTYKHTHPPSTSSSDTSTRGSCGPCSNSSQCSVTSHTTTPVKMATPTSATRSGNDTNQHLRTSQTKESEMDETSRCLNDLSDFGEETCSRQPSRKKEDVGISFGVEAHEANIPTQDVTPATPSFSCQEKHGHDGPPCSEYKQMEEQPSHVYLGKHECRLNPLTSGDITVDKDRELPLHSTMNNCLLLEPCKTQLGDTKYWNPRMSTSFYDPNQPSSQEFYCTADLSKSHHLGTFKSIPSDSVSTTTVSWESSLAEHCESAVKSVSPKSDPPSSVPTHIETSWGEPYSSFIQVPYSASYRVVSPSLDQPPKETSPLIPFHSLPHPPLYETFQGNTPESSNETITQDAPQQLNSRKNQVTHQVTLQQDSRVSQTSEHGCQCVMTPLAYDPTMTLENNKDETVGHTGKDCGEFYIWGTQQTTSLDKNAYRSESATPSRGVCYGVEHPPQINHESETLITSPEISHRKNPSVGSADILYTSQELSTDQWSLVGCPPSSPYVPSSTPCTTQTPCRVPDLNNSQSVTCVSYGDEDMVPRHGPLMVQEEKDCGCPGSTLPSEETKKLSSTPPMPLTSSQGTAFGEIPCNSCSCLSESRDSFEASWWWNYPSNTYPSQCNDSGQKDSLPEDERCPPHSHHEPNCKQEVESLEPKATVTAKSLARPYSGDPTAPHGKACEESESYPYSHPCSNLFLEKSHETTGLDNEATHNTRHSLVQPSTSTTSYSKTSYGVSSSSSSSSSSSALHVSDFSNPPHFVPSPLTHTLAQSFLSHHPAHHYCTDGIPSALSYFNSLFSGTPSPLASSLTPPQSSNERLCSAFSPYHDQEEALMSTFPGNVFMNQDAQTLQQLEPQYKKFLKNIPRKSREAFTPSDIAAFRTCHPHYSKNCLILMQNGYDIRLGEVGRAALKKEISRRLKGNSELRERCVSVVCRLKNANVLQLLQMAEISGCLALGLKISSIYWKEYSKKQRPSVLTENGSKPYHHHSKHLAISTSLHTVPYKKQLHHERPNATDSTIFFTSSGLEKNAVYRPSPVVHATPSLFPTTTPAGTSHRSSRTITSDSSTTTHRTSLDHPQAVHVENDLSSTQNSCTNYMDSSYYPIRHPCEEPLKETSFLSRRFPYPLSLQTLPPSNDLQGHYYNETLPNSSLCHYGYNSPHCSNMSLDTTAESLDTPHGRLICPIPPPSPQSVTLLSGANEDSPMSAPLHPLAKEKGVASTCVPTSSTRKDVYQDTDQQSPTAQHKPWTSGVSCVDSSTWTVSSNVPPMVAYYDCKNDTFDGRKETLEENEHTGTLEKSRDLPESHTDVPYFYYKHDVGCEKSHEFCQRSTNSLTLNSSTESKGIETPLTNLKSLGGTLKRSSTLAVESLNSTHPGTVKRRKAQENGSWNESLVGQTSEARVIHSINEHKEATEEIRGDPPFSTKLLDPSYHEECPESFLIEKQLLNPISCTTLRYPTLVPQELPPHCKTLESFTSRLFHEKNLETFSVLSSASEEDSSNFFESSLYFAHSNEKNGRGPKKYGPVSVASPPKGSFHKTLAENTFRCSAMNDFHELNSTASFSLCVNNDLEGLERNVLGSPVLSLPSSPPHNPLASPTSCSPRTRLVFSHTKQLMERSRTPEAHHETKSCRNNTLLCCFSTAETNEATTKCSPDTPLCSDQVQYTYSPSLCLFDEKSPSLNRKDKSSCFIVQGPVFSPASPVASIAVP